MRFGDLCEGVVDPCDDEKVEEGPVIGGQYDLTVGVKMLNLLKVMHLRRRPKHSQMMKNINVLFHQMSGILTVRLVQSAIL